MPDNRRSVLQLPPWLDWARRLQAVAQTGLAFSHDPFDRARYLQIRDIAVEVVGEHGSLAASEAERIFAAEAGYATPKIDVRGAVFHDDTLLLVRERSDGKWALPGGFADVTESPAEATVREVFEEAGYVTRASKVLAVLDYDRQGHPPYLFRMYKLFFRCDPVSQGALAPNLETLEVAFFAESDIPDLSTLRTTAQEVALVFEHLRDPSRPTDFD